MEGAGVPFGSRPFSTEERNHLAAILDTRLGGEHLAQRVGSNNAKFTYVESWKAIELANSVFGFDVVNIQLDYAYESKDGKHNVGITAIVKVMLKDGTYHEDLGFGSAIDRNKGTAMEKAKKEAVSDARKRALRVFGHALGNCVYDKEHLKAVKSKVKNTATAHVGYAQLREKGDKFPALDASLKDSNSHTSNANTNSTSNMVGDLNLNDYEFITDEDGFGHVPEGMDEPMSPTKLLPPQSSNIRNYGNPQPAPTTFPSSDASTTSANQTSFPHSNPLPIPPQNARPTGISTSLTPPRLNPALNIKSSVPLTLPINQPRPHSAPPTVTPANKPSNTLQNGNTLGGLTGQSNSTGNSSGSNSLLKLTAHSLSNISGVSSNLSISNSNATSMSTSPSSSSPNSNSSLNSTSNSLNTPQQNCAPLVPAPSSLPTSNLVANSNSGLAPLNALGIPSFASSDPFGFTSSKSTRISPFPNATGPNAFGKISYPNPPANQPPQKRLKTETPPQSPVSNVTEDFAKTISPPLPSMMAGNENDEHFNNIPQEPRRESLSPLLSSSSPLNAHTFPSHPNLDTHVQDTSLLLSISTGGE